jgi:hypothetical protein
MKKRTLCFLLAATTSLNVAKAQTMIGIKGGLNLSSFNFSADSLKNQFNPNNLKGLVTGFNYNFCLQKQVLKTKSPKNSSRFFARNADFFVTHSSHRGI